MKACKARASPLHFVRRSKTFMPKILIAEDEPDIQEMMLFMLRREGFEVVLAQDGEEAYILARIERPNLILMDVRMPHVDGYAATRRIKADPDLQHIPVLFVSVRTTPSEKQIALASGGSGYVHKPFSPADILRQIHEALES